MWLLDPLVDFWLLRKQKQVEKSNQRDPKLHQVEDGNVL